MIKEFVIVYSSAMTHVCFPDSGKITVEFHSMTFVGGVVKQTMWVYIAVCLVSTCVVTDANHAHGRPPIPDDPQARLIFQVAEASRTPDGSLSQDEMADIFTKFDLNGNGAIDETEFVAHWTSLNLGDLEHAITLFHRADTDKNGQISRNPDFARLFYYFDRDGDNKISEAEFVTVWYSLST